MTVERSRANLVAAYGLLLLAVLLSQTTLLARLQILGYAPVTTVACTVCVALFEGEDIGALFGLLLGFGIDATVSPIMGLTALKLLLIGFCVGYVARTLMLRNGIAALVLYGASHAGLLLADLLLRLLVTGSWSGYVGATTDAVVAALLSAAWLLLFYPLTRGMNQSFGGEGADTDPR